MAYRKPRARKCKLTSLLEKMGWHLGTAWLSAHISVEGLGQIGLVCFCVTASHQLEVNHKLKIQKSTLKFHFPEPFFTGTFLTLVLSQMTSSQPGGFPPPSEIRSLQPTQRGGAFSHCSEAYTGRESLVHQFWLITPFMLWVGSFHRHCVIGWANVTLFGGKLKTKAKPCGGKAKSMRLKRNVKAGLLFLSKNTVSVKTPVSAIRAILQQRLLQPHLKQFHSLRAPSPPCSVFIVKEGECESGGRGVWAFRLKASKDIDLLSVTSYHWATPILLPFSSLVPLFPNCKT